MSNFLETNYSGFFNADFYSSEIINNEVWFGSDGKVVVYNKRSDFFRVFLKSLSLAIAYPLFILHYYYNINRE